MKCFKVNGEKQYMFLNRKRGSKSVVFDNEQKMALRASFEFKHSLRYILVTFEDCELT